MIWTAAAAAAGASKRAQRMATMRWSALATRSRRRRFTVNNSKSTTNDSTKKTKTGWLYRMAPPKGGTEPPDATFLAIALVVVGAGYYAWFVEPPPKKAE